MADSYPSDMQGISAGMGCPSAGGGILDGHQIGECGFSAHELQTGYSLLQEPDVTLAPFMVPR
eukprot:155052-Karenia_brevis.AAC.1